MNSTLSTKTITRILKSNLLLKSGSNLIIVFEESLQSVALQINKTAKNLGIESLLVFFPKEDQVAIKKSLGSTLNAAINNADVVITCVNDSSECMEFRSLLLDSQNPDLSIGHTPGITLQMLSEFFPKRFTEIDKRSEFLSLALATGLELVIETVDQKGNLHQLKVDIGGWSRLPVISNGTIPRGSWGNLLPAEVYIAPIEETALGSIVINGSFPGLVLENEAILFFSKGRLYNFESTSEIQKFFLKTTETVASQRNDGNWNLLAEVGIGTNHYIRQIIGKPVVDEKIYGTIHIAIGENSGMGGKIDSVLHFDMTTKKPNVFIDQKPLIIKGEIVWEYSNWCKQLQSFDEIELFKGDSIFIRKSSEYKIIDGSLVKVSVNGANRKVEFKIGDHDTCQICVKILEQISDSEVEKVDVKKLSRKLFTTEKEVIQALSFLESFDIINIVK